MNINIERLMQGVKQYVGEQVGTLDQRIETLQQENKALKDELAVLAQEKPKDGADGKDGSPGENGRDALDIEILPYIHAEKSYPRGTYARHAGGLWRSFQSTDGIKGWECIVEGIQEVEVENAGREFTVKTLLSSGSMQEKRFALPVMLYKGIWKGKEHDPGDVTTYAGSSWYCIKPTKAKPGESKDWQLIVKKGRDGKDGQSVDLNQVLSELLPADEENGHA